MVEIDRKDSQVIEKDFSKKRAGNTEVTSVSISREFSDIINEYALSPTEIFRKGLAVQLCELDVYPYNNFLNKQRVDRIKDFLLLKRTIEVIDNLVAIREDLKK